MEKVWKGVQDHGDLKVTAIRLLDQNSETVVLRGFSSHGMQWYPKFAHKQSIEMTKKAGANVFRIAMYTDEGGYLENPAVADEVIRAVDNTLSLDMYAIIDWHILCDNNPLKNVGLAKTFFNEMSRRYSGEPGVIYEICNEPNGSEVTWKESVKPYAEEVIPVIRGNSNAVILVGSPTWSQDVDIAAEDPLKYDNIMYTLHFYAGTHGEELRNKCRRAIELGAPIFASEWGTSAADGDKGVFEKDSDVWLEFLREHNISWCNWSLCDKDETSAALIPGAPDKWTEQHLRQSGRFVYSRLRGF